MEDWVKVFTAVILMVTSFVIAYFAVVTFEPVVAVIAFIVLTYLIYRFANAVVPLVTPTHIIIAVLLSALASGLIVWLGYSLIKVVAIFALTWLLFRLMVKYLAKEIEKDLREVFEE